MLETLPHKLSGAATIIPKALDNPPRETSFITDRQQKRDVLIFPHAKSTDFKLTLPSKTNKPQAFPTGSFYSHPEPTHPPPTYKRPESFYNTSIATAPSPIPEENYIIHTRNLDSVRVNLSSSPGEKSVTGKLKRQPSTTSLGDRESSAFAKLPAALEPESNKNFDMSTRLSESNYQESESGRVNIPHTARPIVISPDVCRSVNMKSQMKGQDDHVMDMQSTTKETCRKTDIGTEQNESQNKVFVSMPLTEANVAKQLNDIVLTNTPENTLDSIVRSPLTNIMTNDDVSLPVSRQDSDTNITNINDITQESMACSSPLPTIRDDETQLMDGTVDDYKTIIGSNMTESRKLEIDIDLI